jgi:ferredoxin
VPYVITGSCNKDEHCIETCPANCIHPTKDEPDFATAAQLYVNPTECIDCVVRASRSARLPRFSIWRNCRRNCRNLFKRKPLTLTKRCLTRPKAHRPPSRGELSFLECGSSPPLLRNDPAKRPDGVCAKSP